MTLGADEAARRSQRTRNGSVEIGERSSVVAGPMGRVPTRAGESRTRQDERTFLQDRSKRTRTDSFGELPGTSDRLRIGCFCFEVAVHAV